MGAELLAGLPEGLLVEQVHQHLSLPVLGLAKGFGANLRDQLHDDLEAERGDQPQLLHKLQFNLERHFLLGQIVEVILLLLLGLRILPSLLGFCVCGEVLGGAESAMLGR